MMSEVDLQSQNWRQRETTVTSPVSPFGILGDLILHWAGVEVDIPPKNSLFENGSMLLSEPKCLLPLMSPRYNLVGLANVCFEGCYWGNKVKKGGSIKGDCRTFYPSFLCYCEISWKALFARGVGEAGTLTAIPYLRVKRMVPVGGKWQKRQVSSSTGDFDGHSLEQWRGC